MNEAEGFSVRYPSGWHVNPGTVAAPCSFFDPEPFDVPAATEFATAINVSLEPVHIDAMLDGLRREEVLEEREEMVGGRRAVHIETESTEDLLFPPGTRAYHYLLERGDETLQMVTYDVPEHDYDAKREILVRMAETVELQ